MKPLHYLVSTYGSGIVIGVIGDKKLAEQEGTLAENMFGSYWTDHLFSSVIHMDDVKQFTKFLMLKEYFAIWDEHWTKNRVSGRRDSALVFSFLRRAGKRARLILEGQVKYENFMQNVSARNNEFTIGSSGYKEEAEAA